MGGALGLNLTGERPLWTTASQRRPVLRFEEHADSGVLRNACARLREWTGREAVSP